MQRRYFPSILLYGFGLALALSLVFNGYLLYEKSRQRSINGYVLGYQTFPIDYVAWQQQLSECKRANEQLDSLVHQLESSPNAPPGKAVTLHNDSPN